MEIHVNKKRNVIRERYNDPIFQLPWVAKKQLYKGLHFERCFWQIAVLTVYAILPADQVIFTLQVKQVRLLFEMWSLINNNSPCQIDFIIPWERGWVLGFHDFACSNKQTTIGEALTITFRKIDAFQNINSRFPFKNIIVHSPLITGEWS